MQSTLVLRVLRGARESCVVRRKKAVNEEFDRLR
jgi:hypothetical protein